MNINPSQNDNCEDFVVHPYVILQTGWSMNPIFFRNRQDAVEYANANLGLFPMLGFEWDQAKEKYRICDL